MTNRRFPIHSLSSLSRYPSARNPARYGEIRSPSFIECALSPWTACAVFLRRPVRADHQCRPDSSGRVARRAGCRSNCAASILCGLVRYSEPAGARLRPRIQYKSQFLARYNGPVGEPKPLRLHDHAGSARAGKLFLARTCTARRRGRSLVGWARNHGDGSLSRPPNVNLFAILAEPGQRVRWQYCTCASDVG